jgi:hypothetical protein
MAQADTNNTTKPSALIHDPHTNMTHESTTGDCGGVFSVSRRSLMNMFVGTAIAGAAVANAAAVISQPVFAAPAESLDAPEASPALHDAVVALHESHERLEAAKARFTADDLKMVEWRSNNPEPAGGRAKKRYWRKWREMQAATEEESWHAQLEAQKDFEAAQMAVARVTPRDENDLVLKAAVAATYDKERGIYGLAVGIISYSVAWDLFKLRMPAHA